MSSPQRRFLTFVRRADQQLCVPQSQTLGIKFAREADRDCLEFRLSLGTIHVRGHHLDGYWRELAGGELPKLTAVADSGEPVKGHPPVARITQIDIRLSDRPTS
jgi:hypothetical protein